MDTVLKKLAVALCVVVMTLGMSACGGSAPPVAEPEAAEHPAEGAEHPAEGAEHPAEGAEHPAEGAEHPAE